jgi:hypothetical protein
MEMCARFPLSTSGSSEVWSGTANPNAIRVSEVGSSKRVEVLRFGVAEFCQ